MTCVYTFELLGVVIDQRIVIYITFCDTKHIYWASVTESEICACGLLIFQPKHVMFTSLASNPQVM